VGGSVKLDARENDFGPFLGFVNDDLVEFSRRYRYLYAAKVGEVVLILGSANAAPIAWSSLRMMSAGVPAGAPANRS
jgi:hypothetical protein